MAVVGVQAQYCTPSFTNGCFSWNTHALSIGTLDFTSMPFDCTVGDYTSFTTPVNAGEAIPMTVTNGAWCGCAVWVDLDNNGSFEDTENLYTIYVGGDPTYTYSFDITLPAGTSSGAHRLRLISPWGSDGTSIGANGYGPCGMYAYGNYIDLTLDVGGTSGIATAPDAGSALELGPNPTTGQIHVTETGANGAFAQVGLFSPDGRMVQTWTLDANGALDADLSGLPAGLYLVRNISGPAIRPVRLVKR
jgi:hypothetical protein